MKLVLQHGDVELRKVVVRTRDYRTGTVELEARFEGERAPVDFTADVSFDGKTTESVAFRNRRAVMKVPEFRLWSHNSPNLHHVTVEVPGAGAAVRSRFGVRQVATANGRITLNGETVYIKGVNRHESHYQFGCTSPAQLMYEDITLVKDLGGKYKDNRPIIVSETGVKADYGVRDPRGKAQMTEDHQAEYTRLMIEEEFCRGCFRR